MWFFLPLIFCIYLAYKILFVAKNPLNNIPGPSLIQNYIDLIKYKSVTDLMKFYKKKYGDIYRFHLMGDLVVSNPQSIKLLLKSNYRGENMNELFSNVSNCNGLFMKNGDQWKDLRNKMAPIFAHGNLKQMALTVRNVSEKYKNYLDSKMKNDELNCEISHIFKKMTLDSMGLIILNYDFNLLNNTETELFDAIVYLIDSAFFRIQCPIHYWNIPLIHKLFDKKLNKHNAVLYKTVMDIIENKKKNPQNDKINKDIIDLLLNIPGISDKDIYDEVIIFIMAGYETTSISLTFMLYCLCKYPKIQIKLRNLLLDINNDENLFDNLNKLKYLDNCIKESMRLYSPVTINIRETLNDSSMEGYYIPQGTKALVLSDGLHIDDRFWQEPEFFNPDRFENEFDENSYLPFGGGRRICFGKPFALMEMKTMMWYLLTNYNFTLNEEITITDNLFKRPDNLFVKIEKFKKE